MSGNSSRRPDGRIIAPDRLCAPHALPFSITATGTSPRRSMSSGSSARRWSSRFAHARPAGPPPTIATPTSIRSSSSSSSRLMNSCVESTGGRYAAGITRPVDAPAIPRSAALPRLHGLGELRDDLVEVAHDAEIGELEDRGVAVLVDRDDVLRGLHADLVLDRAGDAGREVELRRDGLARLADLRRVRVPAGVDDRARRGDRATERAGELLERLEALGVAEAAAAGDEDVGVLDVDIGAALLAAVHHRRLRRPRGELDIDVLDGGGPTVARARLERVQARDDDPALAVARRRDRRVAQDRALGEQLAALDVDRRHLHRHARVQACREAGADLEAEQAAAEQRVAVAARVHDLRHRVDDRLREPLGALDAEDLRGAVAAERAAQVVAQVVAAEHEHVALAAELARQARALGHGAQGVLVELALVVEGVDEDVVL